MSAATQPGFLQYAAFVDEKQMSILGEVSKRFVASPDIDALLEAMTVADQRPTHVVDGEDDLIRMDTT